MQNKEKTVITQHCINDTKNPSTFYVKQTQEKAK